MSDYLLVKILTALFIKYPLLCLKFIKNIPNFIKLYWRLFWDTQVPFYLKLMLITAICYSISPIDFIPDFLIPVIGMIDDIAIIILALRYFIVWCPKEIVLKHVRAIDQESKNKQGKSK
ncbi:MAG: DUF1232 domain-containing protein [bacterium]